MEIGKNNASNFVYAKKRQHQTRPARYQNFKMRYNSAGELDEKPLTNVGHVVTQNRLGFRPLRLLLLALRAAVRVQLHLIPY